VTRVSASRLKLYRRCGQAHTYRYVDKIGGGASSAPAEVGKAVHRVIEYIVGGSDMVATIKPHDDAHDLKLSWSEVSGFSASRALLHQALAQLAARGDVAHQYVPAVRAVLDHVERLNLGWPVEGYGPEHHFELSLAEDVFVHGYIDYMRNQDATFSNEHVEVVDWKTGQLRVEDPAYDEQVGLYLVWAREAFPDAKRITFTLAYLAREEQDRIEWTPDLDRWHRESTIAAVRSMRRGYAPARVGEACTWCDYSDRCEAFASHAEKVKPAESADMPSLDLDHLLSTRNDIRSAAKALEVRQRALDAEIKRRLAENDGKALRGEELTARMVTRRVRTLDGRELPALAERAGVDLLDLLGCSKPSVTQLEKAIGHDDNALIALHDRIRHGSTSYLEVRRARKK